MKTVILQRDITWADPAENCRRCEEAFERHADAELYVLPEMFSTGFCAQPENIAEREGYTLAWMKRQANMRGAAVAGSVATEEDGRYYNRFYFVKPNDEVAYYDKKHLFTYGGEHKRFTPGSERVIVEWMGVRILLQVCYDLRFPIWSRNRGDYDMILYVASWPTSRVEVWNALLVARAIENQCYVAGVNRVGTDPTCKYCGDSVLIDPYGRTIASCPRGEEAEAIADVDMEKLTAFREKFPVLNDADR